MAHYTIHACPQRMWYVNEYLIPSMLEQGILQENILVLNDEHKRGNMWSFMMVQNVKPNLVDHIDYLIGGSILNKTRGNRDARSLFFEDRDLIDTLQAKLRHC